MTSFLWSKIAHKVANARLQSVSYLNELSLRELQKASSEETTRRATPPPPPKCFRTVKHVKNKWEQSSSSPSHRGHLMTAPGYKQRCMALVIRGRRKSSQPKSQIFSGSRFFHTTRQCRTRETISRDACPRRRRYSALAEKLNWHHSQAS